MYKILFGIPAMFIPKCANEKGYIEDYEVPDDADIWCDFELDYNLEEDSYSFSFETMLGFEEKNGCKDWIAHCLSLLNDYMNRHNYGTSKELDLYTVFTEGVNVNTHFETIEDAYAWLKLIVNGFNGKGLEMVPINKET